MNLKEIKDLIYLMNEHGLVELEIEREGFKVRIAKGPIGYTVGQVTQTPSLAPIEAHGSTLQKIPEAISSNAVSIKAPMVGTFYHAASPDAEPFAQEGDVVEEGQIICIIEAMKLMNEIKSEVKGKISKILVENGQPVEFGQPLLLIEKIT